MSVCSFQPPAQGRTSPTKSLQNGSPSKCPRFIKIKNWETGTVYSDTLHHSSSKVRHMEISSINGWIKRSAAAFTFVAEATMLARMRKILMPWFKSSYNSPGFCASSESEWRPWGVRCYRFFKPWHPSPNKRGLKLLAPSDQKNRNTCMMQLQCNSTALQWTQLYLKFCF